MCQIGFIGTVIQWYNTRIHWNHYAMVWCKVGPTLIWSINICHSRHFNQAWISTSKGFGDTPYVAPNASTVHHLQTVPFPYPDTPVLFGQPHDGIPVHVDHFWYSMALNTRTWLARAILFSSANSLSIFAFTFVGMRYYYALEYIQTG